MTKKRIILSISAIALMGLITGCGSSSHHSSAQTTSKNTSTSAEKSVKAIDGYIIGANICDANNVCAATDGNGIAKATFANTALSATAGYIDVNNNHKIDENDIKLPSDFTLKTPAGKNVISPITDLIANGANPAKLAKILGVNEADLYADPIATNNIALAKAIQIVYAVKVDNKESDFVSKINTYNVKNQNNTTSTAQNTNTSSALPDFGVVEVGSGNTENGNINVFANLALSVVSDEAKTLISAVLNSTASTPVALEEAIANTKKELIAKPANEAAQTNTASEANTTAQTKNVAAQTNTATETNTTAQTKNVAAQTNKSTQTQTETNSNNSALPQF